MLYNLSKHALFALSPETAHNVALQSLSLAQKTGLSTALFKREQMPTELWGLKFYNPVGLAAGLDKNGDYIDALAGVGFGFLEIGTVTPRPQPGNPKPRLFRLASKQAIINRMGFNNKGVDHLVAKVRQSHYRGVLGVNIGKNFDTPVEKALDDYLICLRKVYGYASYVVINISSPNTQGLRSLQYGESLDQLLSGLKKAQLDLANEHGKYVPLVIKIAPDLEPDEVNHLAEQLLHHEVDGVIATNTTLSRDGVEQLEYGNETGGLSGAPLLGKSTEVLKQLCGYLDDRIPVIGVGGITTGADAVRKIQAGAKLVQIYTGFIYHGPELIRQSVHSIRVAK